MRKVIFALALTVNAILGGTLAALAGVPPALGSIALNAVALASPLLGVDGLREGVYTEVWTGEMIKQFRTSIESIGWLNKIRSYDQYASNDVIHFVDIGGDPDVLVNNTTYPLAIQDLADADKAVKLDKYQTQPTRITDDELYAISYDKMASVLERHRDKMNETKYAKAIAALAPNGDTAQTPVILTTGDASQDGTRSMLSRRDIIALKAKFDANKVPAGERVLVLCGEHVQDLLLNDQKFADQYYKYESGKISNLYGFEVYEYTDNPHYAVSTKTKVAYGVAPTGTDRQASVAYYAPRMMKCTGETKSYLSAAKDSPTTQENLVNFRHYFICLPLKNEAIGAIVSNFAPEPPEPPANGGGGS
jgi:hypothetical protein